MASGKANLVSLLRSSATPYGTPINNSLRVVACERSLLTCATLCKVD